MPWKKRRSSHAYASDDMVVYGLVDKEGAERGHRHRHHHHHHHHSSHRSRKPWMAWLWAIPVLLVIAAGLLGIQLYRSAKTMRSQAQETMTSLNTYLKSAKAGDAQQLAISATEVSNKAHALKDELSGGEWTIASYIPVLGSDVKSVRTLGDVLVDLSDEALVPLSQSTDIMSLSTLMQESAVNMDAVTALSNIVRQTHPVVTRSAAAIEELPPAHIKQIASVLEPAREALGDARAIMNHALPLLEHLPYLLGANGQERKYLVLGNNIAEIHSIGGFVGMVGMITVKDGHFTLGDFTGINDKLDSAHGEPLGATDEERALFGDRCETHHGDINVIPDFSRVGSLYQTGWWWYQDEFLDGVLSFDPVFLQGMLELTGPVETSYGVTVDGTNAASMILNQCLFMWSATDCDDFYKDVAHQAFDNILANLGSIDTLGFLRLISDAGDEGRCMAWVADSAAEEAVKQSGFGMPMGHDAAKPQIGFYVADSSGSKASYYLSIDSTVGDPKKNSDGTTSYSVTTILENHADRSLLSTQLPSYLNGSMQKTVAGASALCLHEDTYLIGPEGGHIEGIQATFDNLYANRHDMVWEQKTYQGLDAWSSSMILDAGERCIVTYTVVTSSAATEPLKVVQTPVVPREIRGDAAA